MNVDTSKLGLWRISISPGQSLIFGFASHESLDEIDAWGVQSLVKSLDDGTRIYRAGPNFHGTAEGTITITGYKPLRVFATFQKEYPDLVTEARRLSSERIAYQWRYLGLEMPWTENN